MTFPRAISILEREGEFEAADLLRSRSDPIALRNSILIDCIATHFADHNPRQQAKLSAQSMSRYFASGWLRDRDGAAMPAHLRGTPAEYWWRMYRFAPRPLAYKTVAAVMTLAVSHGAVDACGSNQQPSK